MADLSTDINIISHFLSRGDITTISSIGGIDCIVLCVCSVLYSSETVFEALIRQPNLTKTVVLCGGIGHSTEHIHNAVAHHPKFNSIAVEISGLPEAQVLYAIWKTFYAHQLDPQAAPRILIEDRSITCATNAIEARKLLEANGIPTPGSMVVVQDPTMVRRTVACFDRVYSDITNPPKIHGCPVFVPLVERGIDGQLTYKTPPVSEELMWEIDRFLELIMGEIPRLRDDENGRGPKGRGEIVHVDLPVEIEEAYERLAENTFHRSAAI
ncbi:hypothetical protein N0V90_001480 [Kalmusia sp. IMI 367209]|nr:hypothetical protein N0V90_001480 [Kalmusia sp. IMI 367209]